VGSPKFIASTNKVFETTVRVAGGGLDTFHCEPKSC
jgi:hypothetical protein